MSKCRVFRGLLCDGRLWFSIFPFRIEDGDRDLILSCKSMGTSVHSESYRGVCRVSQFSNEVLLAEENSFAADQTEEQDVVLRKTNKYVNMLQQLHLNRRATEEVKEFNASSVIQRIRVEVEVLLLWGGP